jgi:hypothetical protein
LSSSDGCFISLPGGGNSRRLGRLDGGGGEGGGGGGGAPPAIGESIASTSSANSWTESVSKRKHNVETKQSAASFINSEYTGTVPVQYSKISYNKK